MAARQPGRQARAAGLRALSACVAIAGGYGVTALAVQVLASALARAGMAGSEAVASAAMLGFPAYLALLMWALPCAGLARLLATLGPAAALLGAAAWWLAGARP